MSKYDFSKPPGRVNVLVGCCGSVAAIKIPLLVQKIAELGLSLPMEIETRVVTTEHAKHFFNPSDLSVFVYEDRDEWDCWQKRGDPVLHIELRKWADVFLIAPLDANTLAKLSSGICDNLLTCIARAWDFSKPVAFAPAMNTHMWEHPVTDTQVRVLKDWGYTEIPCISKTLVCGDSGKGAMAEVGTLVDFVRQTVLNLSPATSQK